jgi:hypothetical protein
VSGELDVSGTMCHVRIGPEYVSGYDQGLSTAWRCQFYVEAAHPEGKMYDPGTGDEWGLPGYVSVGIMLDLSGVPGDDYGGRMPLPVGQIAVPLP